MINRTACRASGNAAGFSVAESSPARARASSEASTPGTTPGTPRGLEAFVRDYGYLAIVIVTFFEGETIVILAGVAAAAGHLDPLFVIAAALAGAVSGDQLWYLIGRRFGPPVLARGRGRWVQAAHRMLALLQRHELWLMLTFRFYYGLRAVAPFAIGAAGIAPGRYLVLNVTGALLWAVTFTAAGYLAGDAVVGLVSRLGWYGTLAAVVSIIATVIAVRSLRSRHRPPVGPVAAPTACAVLAATGVAVRQPPAALDSPSATPGGGHGPEGRR